MSIRTLPASLFQKLSKITLGLVVKCTKDSHYNLLTRLVVAYMANTKLCKKPKRLLKPWHMSTHLRVLSKIYTMNANLTGFR